MNIYIYIKDVLAKIGNYGLPHFFTFKPSLL